MNDTDRLNWLEETDCYSLICDDGGRWACVMEGMQNVPLEEKSDIWTSFVVKADEWKDSIREAIDSAIDEEVN